MQAVKFSLSSVILGLALSLAGCSSAPSEGVDSTSDALSSKCAPAVPDPSLAVPAGNNLAFKLDAIGVQIYACQVSGTSYSWVFQEPSATLYEHHGHVAGTHFKGPTWQANDGSQVVGTKLAGFTPDASAIPWLLLQATSHTGAGRMANITYVQRLDTVGGLAPTTGCDADHVGTLSDVDYTATYYFYAAASKPPCGCK